MFSSLESGLVITGEQCSRHSRAVWSSLESNVLVTREWSGHHWRAMCSSLESGRVITREPCAHHWRAVWSSLESHVPITGERSSHPSRAMCPSLEIPLGKCQTSVTPPCGSSPTRTRTRTLVSNATTPHQVKQTYYASRRRTGVSSRAGPLDASASFAPLDSSRPGNPWKGRGYSAGGKLFQLFFRKVTSSHRTTGCGRRRAAWCHAPGPRIPHVRDKEIHHGHQYTEEEPS